MTSILAQNVYQDFLTFPLACHSDVCLHNFTNCQIACIKIQFVNVEFSMSERV